MSTETKPEPKRQWRVVWSCDTMSGCSFWTTATANEAANLVRQQQAKLGRSISIDEVSETEVYTPRGKESR